MEETLEILQDNLGQALIDTAYMVVVSAIIGVVLGTLVALLLYLTEKSFVHAESCVERYCRFHRQRDSFAAVPDSHGGAYSGCAIDSG